MNIGTPLVIQDTLISKLNGSAWLSAAHGLGHRISPSELPSRANIYAMKSLGVEQIIAVNSAGSFKEEIRPGTLVIPDQVIDCTKGRVGTFFNAGIVAHISMAEPFCPDLSNIMYDIAVEVGASVKKGGTFIAMEGPAFSTRAESNLYRSWDADIIGMTVLPEAKLAREAEICYASIVCVTDYDCWMERAKAVDVATILNNMKKNTDMAKAIIRRTVTRIPKTRSCSCKDALDGAIVTAPELIPPAKKEALGLIIGKYIS
jgi:5'-methylthioadenosine phosphorylase